MNPKYRIIYCGDFNIEATGHDMATKTLHNVMRASGLYCTNFEPTRGPACIDYIFTDFHPSTFFVKVLDLPISHFM